MAQIHKKFFLVVFLFSQIANAADGIWAANIESLLQKKGVSKNQYGIEIRGVNGSPIYFSSNSNQPFNPASTMKTLISIASLEELGVNYKFSTIVKKKDRDVCLIGQGDPSLVYEDMFLIVEKLLRSQNFQKPTVDHIFVDDSYFPTQRQYDEEFEGDSQRSFTAPISSMSLNYNSVTVFADPSKIGSDAFVSTEPTSNYFRIHNNAKTSKNGGQQISVRTEQKNDHLDIFVSGQIGFQDKQMIIYRAVPDPSLYAGFVFKELLRRAGVVIQNSVEKKTCPADATEMVNYQSKSLSQIVMGMNKFSNNFIAESLLIQLGDQKNSASGMQKVKQWISKKNFPMTNVQIENASGLSRNNTVTPNFLWELFSYGRNDYPIAYEFMSSLPIGATDGTLRRRFKSPLLAGRVRAKSGSLNNVTTLAGTIDTQGQGELLFVFLFNNSNKSGYEIQSIEEQVLETLATLGKTGQNIKTL